MPKVYQTKYCVVCAAEMTVCKVTFTCRECTENGLGWPQYVPFPTYCNTTGKKIIKHFDFNGSDRATASEGEE